MPEKRITLVVGARPNFMKAAPLWKALAKENWATVRLVHTGQHFDKNMSSIFFEELAMPQPDAFLGIITSGPAQFVAQAIELLAKDFAEHPPMVVVVFGDVNSTLAAAIVANKMGIPLAHVEAGLRSFDREMPEEHNRVVTDMLSDYLFTPSPDGDENLIREGVARQRIFHVGNIMVDTLLEWKTRAEKQKTYSNMGLSRQGYALVTLHRPSNVDNAETLGEVWLALEEISRSMPVIFPVHPRTRKSINNLNMEISKNNDLKLIDPVGYLDFVNLMMHARVVLTDSGGVQEETTILSVPCLTLRRNTERPITITQGTNHLVGESHRDILAGFHEALESSREANTPDLWDGKTAERIVEILRKELL